MVTQGSLKKILGMCAIAYSGSLARYHTCPICWPLEVCEMEWERPLRIFSSLEGEFLFRCNRCGTTFDSLELISRALKLPYDKVSSLMFEKGIIPRLNTPQELEGYKWKERLMYHFEIGRRHYDYMRGTGRVLARFGEWGSFNVSLFSEILPVGMNRPRRDDKSFLIRLLRDVFGRVSRMEVWSEGWLPLGSVTLHKTPVTLSMPPWALFHDINELILCDSEQTAEEIERVVAAWPQEERIPVARPVDLDCFPIASRLPYSRVWFATRQDGLGELGLVLYQKGMTEVKIRRFPGNHNEKMPSLEGITKKELCQPDLDCMEEVVTRVVHGSQETLMGRLSTVMGRNYISGEAKRELLQRCAAESGISEDNLLNQLEADANPYGMLDRGRLFVCRNGRYFMMDRKGRCSGISNFSIRSVAKTINAKGDAIHDLRLSIDGQTTTFSVTDALLDSPPRLWKETRRVAALAGLPELIMTNAQHRNLLPSLIKSTAQVTCGR